MTVDISAVNAALDKIYSYVDYSMTHAEDTPSAVFSLRKIRRLLERLGNPQDAYRCVHVAGTKGKGSVCTLIYEVLRAAGYSVGLYTSPHLIQFNERIQVNGRMISDADIVRLTEVVTAEIDAKDPASSFDIMTAIAFTYFAEADVDFAVIETGLGGRLDSTNVIAPILTVITSISLDHMNFLGDTIEKIAAEKGGIIKPGIPLIAAPENPAARQVLREIARDRDAEWIDVEEIYGAIPVTDSPTGQRVLIWDKRETQNPLDSFQNFSGRRQGTWQFSLPLAGFHQTRNAATAFAALMKLKSYRVKINIGDIRRGFARAFWPCRFETIQKKPTVILDGAHNPDSMEKLAQTVNRYYGTKEIVCVFGVSEDKNVGKMIRILVPFVRRFIVTRSTHPRAMDPRQLAEIVQAEGRAASVCQTLEMAKDAMDQVKSNQVLLVTGSLFVTAGIRSLYMQENKQLKYYSQRNDLEIE